MISMRENLFPQIDTIPNEMSAANDGIFEGSDRADIVDIKTGEAYSPEPVPETVEASDATVPLVSAYEAALRRLSPDTEPAPTDAQLDQSTSVETTPPDSVLESRPPAEDLPPLEWNEGADLPKEPEPEIAPLPSAESIPESAAETAKEIPEDVVSSFAERFPGITKEGLESIEGFDALSRGQQLQMLENLSQITVGRIQEDAKTSHDESIAAEKKSAKFLGKIWVSLKDSFTKKFDIVNREKQIKEDIVNSGIEEHRGVLEQMAKGMKELGPEISVAEDGKLEMQLIETKGLSPELAKVAEVFNKQGTALSKIPYEWSLDSATPDQQKAFKEAKDIYEEQRKVLMSRMSEAHGDEAAVKAMSATESMIEMQRFIQTCPDSASALEGIEDQNAVTAALKSVGAERGYYAVGGAIARTAIVGIAGIAAAPIVAAASGAIRGWQRSGEELLAQDRAQRAGEEVASETAKNMIAAVRAEGKEGEEGYRGSVEKIEALVAKLRSAEESGEDTSKLAAQLKRRIDYSKLKISEGKMVFGDAKERLANQYALTSAMAKAEAALATETAVDENGDKAARRLERMLNLAEGEIHDARMNKRTKQAIMAGGIGFLAAGAGAELADAVKWMNGSSGTYSERMFGDADEFKSNVAEAIAAVKAEVEEIGGKVGARLAEVGEAIGAPAALALEDAPINGLDLPPDYVLPGSGGDWVETPSGLRVLAEDLETSRVVASGDSLSRIFSETIPERPNAEIVSALRSMNAEELRSIGVSSGNPDLIRPGETIDIAKMREYLDAHPRPLAGTLSESSSPSDLGVIEKTESFPRSAIEDSGGANSGESVAPDGGRVDFVATEGEGTEVVVSGKGGSETTSIDDAMKGPASERPVPASSEIVREGMPIPSRRLSEISAAELSKWPADKPLPWPVSASEAQRLFGENGPTRELAETVLKATGRYPNQTELAALQAVGMSENGAPLRALIISMNPARGGHPLSFVEANKIVAPVLARQEIEAVAGGSGTTWANRPYPLAENPNPSTVGTSVRQESASPVVTTVTEGVVRPTKDELADPRNYYPSGHPAAGSINMNRILELRRAASAASAPKGGFVSDSFDPNGLDNAPVSRPLAPAPAPQAPRVTMNDPIVTSTARVLGERAAPNSTLRQAADLVANRNVTPSGVIGAITQNASNPTLRAAAEALRRRTP